jgi:hypothetical protein
MKKTDVSFPTSKIGGTSPLFHEHATMFDDGIPVFVLSRTLLVGGFNMF